MLVVPGPVAIHGLTKQPTLHPQTQLTVLSPKVVPQQPQLQVVLEVDAIQVLVQPEYKVAMVVLALPLLVLVVLAAVPPVLNYALRF